MQIGFIWIDASESKNYVDLFDENIFVNGAKQLPIEHDVFKPNGRFYGRARCLMTVRNASIELNYAVFPKHNNDKGMLLGITKFTYDKAKSPPIYDVVWRNKNDDKFYGVKIDFIRRPAKKHTQSEEIATFNTLILDAAFLSDQELKDLLPTAGFKPPQRVVTTTVYLRNPYVVAFVLRRANGACEKCRKKAPFISHSTGNPYLEVHHVQPLSKGGADDINNSLAVCPNCHREIHHGSEA